MWQMELRQLTVYEHFGCVNVCNHTDHDHWLTSDRHVAIAWAKHIKSSSLQLDIPLPVKWEDIDANLEKAGFSKVYEYEMQVKVDLTNPDESLLHFYDRNRSITLIIYATL